MKSPLTMKATQHNQLLSFTISKSLFTYHSIHSYKRRNRLNPLKTLFFVKDDIEHGFRNTIPLWAFGLNY